MKKFFWCFALTVWQTAALCAGKYFDFSPRATDAYQKVISLRFDEANAALGLLKQQEPDNLIAVFVENYLEVLRIGIDDDEEAYERLLKNMDERLYLLSKGEPRSPYLRYTQAEIRLQWAFLSARFGHYLSCLNDLKQAYASLEENQALFPDFVANKKSLGILHALIGNVPDEYRWAVRLLAGMDGSIKQGLAEIDAVLNYAKTNEFLFEEESLIAYALLQVHLNNQSTKAWFTLNNSKLKASAHPMAAFVFAHVALRNGRTSTAIEILQKAPKGDPYYPFPHCNYLLGMAKLYRLDSDANLPLEAFLQQFKGKSGIKETHQKLAWHALLQGNISGYYSSMWNVKQYGSTRSDPDKVALREAKSGEIPEARLLKARLLFDGAYFSKAYDLLKNIGAEYQSDPHNNLEYQYRLGRITHKLGKSDEAIHYYQTTINEGAQLPWYFACNAALQLGILHEEKMDFRSAKTWYNKCLAINPEEYAASLHAKAKAGLNRLAG